LKLARPVLCLALVASVTAAGAAGAVTKPKPKPLKPVCNLVTDPAGDATPQAPLPNDDSLDILSADIASDAKSFTAVIRVKNVAAQGLSQLGSDLQVDFDLAGAEATVWMGYNNSAYGGQAFQYGVIGKGDAGSTSPTGDAVGIIDTAKNEIRITVPVADMNALGKAKPGAKVSNITVSSSQVAGIAPNPSGVYAFNSLPVDDASATKSYVAGYPSCVKPGK
jgi:hypothetical protein